MCEETGVEGGIALVAATRSRAESLRIHCTTNVNSRVVVELRQRDGGSGFAHVAAGAVLRLVGGQRRKRGNQMRVRLVVGLARHVVVAV